MKISEKDLTKLSTIRVKSHAKYFCEPENIDDIKKAIDFSDRHNLQIEILGNGSNILFSKEIYKQKLFLKLTGEFSFFEEKNGFIEIGAAYSLKLAGKKMIKLGLEDYVFFNLIPACIGGAITQNAGTGSDGEIKDVCMSVKLFDVLNNKVIELSNKNCLFGYRDSIMKKERGRFIILSGKFNSKNKVPNIKNLITICKDRMQEKVNREPLGYSFGSTFVNNKLPAWECVKRVKNKLSNTKGAFYSEKHNNWIINNENAKGEDIVSLIKNTQKIVKEELGFDLINEVRIV
tara:strand:+ start:2607 stop:3476 length:870 start_codon:yes stop_codon:yes gene_type:complete